MNCPECKAPGVYIGMLQIECKNSLCRHYKASPAGSSPSNIVVGQLRRWKKNFIPWIFGHGWAEEVFEIYTVFQDSIQCANNDRSAGLSTYVLPITQIEKDSDPIAYFP